MLKRIALLSIIVFTIIPNINIYAADDLDIDSLLNEVDSSNSSSNNNTINNKENKEVNKESNNSINEVIDEDNKENKEDKKIEVIQNWNEIIVKNWDADYLFIFEPQKNIKINKNTIQVKNNNENLDFIIEDAIKTYKEGDILEKWKEYMIELWWNFDEVKFVLADDLKPIKIVKKVNNTLDVLGVKPEYVFSDKKESKEKVDTKIIKKKKSGIVENTMAVIILFMIILYAFRKNKNEL